MPRPLPTLALTLALFASPAQAETAQISLVFGPDRLSASAEDIRSLHRIDEKGLGAALVITLAPAFDARMVALTSAHVGETGALLVCGETVVTPHIHAPIPEATFVISDTDPTRIDRLETLLAAPACDPVPRS